MSGLGERLSRMLGNVTPESKGDILNLVEVLQAGQNNSAPHEIRFVPMENGGVMVISQDVQGKTQKSIF